MDRAVPPWAGETEVAPGARRAGIGSRGNREDRAQLRECQPLDRIALVHEDDERVIPVANVEAAGHHIDACRRVAKHLLERSYLGGPSLAPHECEIAAAGIQRTNRGRSARRWFSKRTLGSSRWKPCSRHAPTPR